MKEFEIQQGGVPTGDVELNAALKRGIQKFDVLNSWLHENEIHPLPKDRRDQKSKDFVLP